MKGAASQGRSPEQSVTDALFVETILRAHSVPTANTLCQVGPGPGGGGRSSLNAQIADVYGVVKSVSLERMLLKQRFGGGPRMALLADLHHVGGEVLVSRHDAETLRLADFLRNIFRSGDVGSTGTTSWLVQEMVVPLPLIEASSAQELHSIRLTLGRDPSDGTEIRTASLVRRSGPNLNTVETIAIDVATGVPAGGEASGRGAGSVPSWEHLRCTVLKATSALQSHCDVEWEAVLSPSGPVVVGARSATT